MCKAVVVGSLNLDTSITLERMPQPGETIAAQGVSLNPGGKGANQAFALGRPGLPRCYGGRGGPGRRRGHLAGKPPGGGGGLLLCGPPGGAHRPGVHHRGQRRGENAIIILAGANSTVSPADVEKLRPLLAQADCLVLQLEIPLETVAAAAKLARSLGKVVILDPAPAPGPLPGELLALCDYLKPNETELALLTGLPTATVEQCETAARQLLAQGVGTVLVSLGAKGALAVTPQEALLVAPPQVKAVDTTSAGDCFTAAFALRLVEGETSLQAALEFANAAAALTASRPGAQASIPARDEVEALLAAR